MMFVYAIVLCNMQRSAINRGYPGCQRSSRSPAARNIRASQGTSEQVALIGKRPLAQAVKSFERADPITLPFISPESKFDRGNLIGRLKKRFLKGLLLVKCMTILSKPVLTKAVNCVMNTLSFNLNQSRYFIFFV